MTKNGVCKENSIKANSGFSLVELIVVVSILAIAAIPLMKSMSMSTRVNARAQSIQNATSLGEKIMEEFKSSSIADIKSAHGGGFDASGKYVITLSDQRSTQGETFDVVVTIDKEKYGQADDETTHDDDVIAANKLKLPAIEEIDTLSQAVLSSRKDLNKYDKEAKNYFNQKLAKYDSSTVMATITSKKIEIEKDDVTFPTGVRVKVKVTYTDDATPANKYVRELYTGTFVPLEKDGSSTETTVEYKPLDSNIYIFYEKNSDTSVIPSTLQEEISINDSSGYTSLSGAATMDSHRVYFIRQDISDVTGPKLTINGETFTYSNIDSLTDGERTFGSGKVLFVSNLGSSVSSTDGHIYKSEAKIRVYDITVELKKDGEVIHTLNSTIRAQDNEADLPTAP